MQTRREFLKHASLLSGGLGVLATIPQSILRAMSIEPAEGSTFIDAEHIVILMQENRSFDHALGSLGGVRGFDDPRAIQLPGGNPVWLQTDADGNIHAPFRLNMRDSRSTWMRDLPHDRESQVAASNDGKHNLWLLEKQSGHKEYADMPLTLGYYERDDLPFYYQFADAFTVCDQYFCSANTCTNPNRLYLWTGTVRDPRDPSSAARLTNSHIDHDHTADWTTFPERLEEHGVSWRIYQNELWLNTGLDNEDLAWLGNFGDNPLEYFSQYHLGFHPARMAWVEARIAELDRIVAGAQATPAGAKTDQGQREVPGRLLEELAALTNERQRFSREAFANLPEKDKALCQKAFTTNTGDPDQRRTVPMRYHDGAVEREVKVPAGDLFHQFRKDVREGKLPTVSWLVAPENFSDHPAAPWYGAWYVSEALDILTDNPEVWKKTVFILTYDENDGYFDHVPPFVPPHTGKPGTGAASKGLDTSLEFDEHGRPIGLGYRVPMVIASPWTRGGNVCSEVFDHTSVLRFLEVFLSNKTTPAIRETNISGWRRMICGDLTSAFQAGPPPAGTHPVSLKRDVVVETIHRSQFKEPPADFRSFRPDEIERVRREPTTSPLLARQEKGGRPSCALPYELHADFRLDRAAGAIGLTLAVGERSVGAPFHVYAPGKYGPDDVGTYTDAPPLYEEMRRWSFAVRPGDQVPYSWPVGSFEGGLYHLRLYGPNGFYRGCRGSLEDPAAEIVFLPEADGSGNAVFEIRNAGPEPLEILIEDLAYGSAPVSSNIAPAEHVRIPINLQQSHRWYDLGVSLPGPNRHSRRYAGRIETGKAGPSDPAIGRFT
jgi:phospholipase C